MLRQKGHKYGRDYPGRGPFVGGRAGFPITSEIHIDEPSNGSAGFSWRHNRPAPDRAWRWLSGVLCRWPEEVVRAFDRGVSGNWRLLRSFSGTRLLQVLGRRL